MRDPGGSVWFAHRHTPWTPDRFSHGNRRSGPVPRASPVVRSSPPELATKAGRPSRLPTGESRLVATRVVRGGVRRVARRAVDRGARPPGEQGRARGAVLVCAHASAARRAWGLRNELRWPYRSDAIVRSHVQSPGPSCQDSGASPWRARRVRGLPAHGVRGRCSSPVRVTRHNTSFRRFLSQVR